MIDYNQYNSFADAKHDYVCLTPTGFKLLIEESISEVLETELKMRPLGKCIWVTDYENHRRKVVTLFNINDSFATLQWGWNYDFISSILK